MTLITLETKIQATIELCFDLSRDIGVHLQSAEHTGERVVTGRTNGLCEPGDTITWEAVHFGVRQRLTVQITNVEPPVMFADRMLKGAFKSMKHEHYYESVEGFTLMTDKFYYETPFGLLGKLFDKIALKKHMTNFLLKRNQMLKELAENFETQSKTSI